MKGEEGYFRFFAYLGLFIFMMTCLVMGNNFIMLYLGWEGVGLCSYLLVGYYYDKPSAREAAKKAFLVNRVGDFGFGIGIMLIFLTFGTISFFGDGLHGHAPGVLQLATMPLDQLAKIPGVNVDWVPTALNWIPFCLMLGAFGKSAQFPLYVWLPDAMEGPTPVSALIHAATMVTAGIYMIARCGTLFVTNEAAMITVGYVGAFTALFAATIALRQFDLKKVFAYSTVSQLGFMFAAVGCWRRSRACFTWSRTRSSRRSCSSQRRGHARDAGRTGHAQDVRPQARAPQDPLAHADRLHRAGRAAAVRGVLLQGRDHRRRLGAQ
jgi:NADH-quinone oxidoreductase subunit L